LDADFRSSPSPVEEQIFGAMHLLSRQVDSCRGIGALPLPVPVRNPDATL